MPRAHAAAHGGGAKHGAHAKSGAKHEHEKGPHREGSHGQGSEHAGGPHKEHSDLSSGRGGHSHHTPDMPSGRPVGPSAGPPAAKIHRPTSYGELENQSHGIGEPDDRPPRRRTDDAPASTFHHKDDFEPHHEEEEPMSIKLRTNFMDRLRAHAEQRNVNPLWGETKITAKICGHPFFEPFALVAIVFNALWIGYSTDQEDPDGKEPPFSTKAIDNMFCFWFVVEILLRIGAYRTPISFFIGDKPNRLWNNFDFVLVCFLVGETVLLPMATKGSGKTPAVPALSSLRLLRLLRVVRVLRFVPELAMMVRSLVAAIRSVTTTFALAVGIMYIFSIVFTQWARTHEQKYECDPPVNCVEAAFGSIAKSFLTLFQILCFDATFSLIRAILKERPLYGCLLLVFIVIAAFTVLNMLIGVVCQIVAQTSANERSASMKLEVSKLLKLLEIEDTGFISKKELERNKHVLSELDKAGVDEETIKTATHILDRKMQNKGGANQEAIHIDLEEFMEVIFKLLHPPQTQDILLVQSKLEKLERALGANSGESQGAAASAAIKEKTAAMNADDDDENHVMDESTRSAVESSIWELESQVSAMLDHAMQATGRSAPPREAAWDVELKRLDAAMCRLRVRLERCQDEAGPTGTGRGGPADEAVELAANELQYWRKLCGEVVQSISVASTLMAQAQREAEPSDVGPLGMFRGDSPFRDLTSASC